MRGREFLIVCAIAALLMFVNLPAAVVRAQGQSKQAEDAQKPASTADAWKQALPDNEETPSETDAKKVAPVSTAEDTPAQLEKRLGELERGWLDAVSARDSAALRRILAADFTFIDARAAGYLFDRKQYLADAVRERKPESYSLDELRVRLYANSDAAVVDGWYRQQNTAAGEPCLGGLLFTDVWVRRAGIWKAVSRHLSCLPAGAPQQGK